MTQSEIRTLQRAITKLNEELIAFAKGTGEPWATLYEDAFTTYQVTDIKLAKSGKSLTYLYNFCDGRGFFHEKETVYDADDVREYLKFWKAGLRRAKKYWSMNTEDLDAIYDFQKEDIEVEC